MSQDGDIQHKLDSDQRHVKLGASEFEAVLAEYWNGLLTPNLPITWQAWSGSRGALAEVPYQALCRLKLSVYLKQSYWLKTALPNPMQCSRCK